MMREKYNQAKDLTKKLEKIVKLAQNTESTQAAIDAEYELSVFNRNLDTFSSQFGQDNSFVRQCKAASKVISDRLEQSLAAYI